MEANATRMDLPFGRLHCQGAARGDAESQTIIGRMCLEGEGGDVCTGVSCVFFVSYTDTNMILTRLAVPVRDGLS